MLVRVITGFSIYSITKSFSWTDRKLAITWVSIDYFTIWCQNVTSDEWSELCHLADLKIFKTKEKKYNFNPKPEEIAKMIKKDINLDLPHLSKKDFNVNVQNFDEVRKNINPLLIESNIKLQNTKLPSHYGIVLSPFENSDESLVVHNNQTSQKTLPSDKDTTTPNDIFFEKYTTQPIWTVQNDLKLSPFLENRLSWNLAAKTLMLNKNSLLYNTLFYKTDTLYGWDRTKGLMVTGLDTDQFALDYVASKNEDLILNDKIIEVESEIFNLHKYLNDNNTEEDIFLIKLMEYALYDKNVFENFQHILNKLDT